MFVVKIENAKKEVLRLTQNENNYQVIRIDGLNPPKAQINTATVAAMDGSKFNSAKVENRNIVITIVLRGDIEANRQAIYNYAAIKHWCKFYFKNERRDVFTECYVENIECNLFENGETMQISLLCPNPYFKNVQEILNDISKAVSAFEFPFSFGSNGATNPDVEIDTSTDDAIEFSILNVESQTNIFNASEIETGVIINIDVLLPCNQIQIRNTTTGDLIVVTREFLVHDKIYINTNKGSKSIYLARNAETINLFSSLGAASVFFQLVSGDNIFDYAVDEGASNNAVQILFKHYTQFGGV